MRKNVFGRNLKRDTKERKALFRSLMSSLVLEERIKTTEEKAKAIKGQVEKLVTRAKKGGTHVETLLSPHLNAEAIKKMTSDVAPRFTDRPGGYTRIIRLDRRFNDNASLVLIEWVEKSKMLTATNISEKKAGSGKTKVKATAKVSVAKEKKTAKPKKSTVKKAVKKE
jgi:large subunit ribosomal protein L17